MTISIWRSWLGAAVIGLAGAMPVQAGVVTFDDVGPNGTAGGGSITSGGFTFTDDSFGGFITIDSAAALIAPPANPDGQFLSMFNNAGVVMTSTTGSAFSLSGFDAAFLAVLPLQGGFLGGELTVVVQDRLGALFQDTFMLPAGVIDNDYPFDTFFLGAAQSTVLNAAYFYSCAYQSNGACTSDGLLPAQFALDNIVGNLIPEPGSAVLVLTALGVLFIRRRKPTAA